MSDGLTIRNVPQVEVFFAFKTAIAAFVVLASTSFCTFAAAEQAIEKPRGSSDSGSVVATPVAMFGRDERRSIGTSEAWLRRRIGLLHHRDTGKLCTAFCIATDTVATAGHCVAQALANGEAGLSEIRYSPDAADELGGFSIRGAQTGLAHRSVAIGARKLQTRAPINATDDWAVLRLESRACPDGGLPFADRRTGVDHSPASSSKIYNVSYHRDFGNLALAIAGPCGLAAASRADGHHDLAADFTALDDLRLHDCDTGAASSGSPLLAFGPAGVTVVAMNIGTYVRSSIITHDGEVVRRLVSETIANTAVDAGILRRAAMRLQAD